nr:retrotransposon protein, putative, unclassified [Tanacetum cinerariifolium]
MSDTDSLVNSVHEGDTPKQKVTPPPQITTVTSLSAKFPYLKKGKYDIWAMQNYISSTDLQCWNIFQKGNNQKNITSGTEGNIIISPPVTVKEHMQVQREEKARTMLLTALPDEHMGDFYHMIDAKQIWSAIKARFGGNAESTRMRRSLLKHQFKEYKASEEEGLDEGYDKMQKILSKMNTLKIKPDQEDINMNDYLGKFDAKADEGYIIGYSIPGKAYRVYNLVTGKIVETMNIKFLENLPSVEGTAQSVLSPSLNLNDDDMEALTSLQTQEQDRKDAAQRLGLAFPTHVVTHETSSIPAEKSSSVSPASSPTASAGNTPLVFPRTSASRLSKSTGKQLASSSKTPIPADRSVSAGKLIPADRSISARKPFPTDRSISTDKSISADRSISALRVTNSADRRPRKLSSNVVSERFPPASNTQNSDIHDGLKLFDCLSTGIFSSSSYDDEYHGPDISNQEKEIIVNPVTSKKVNEAHPHSLIIGKHVIGTKWILKNKRDARGIAYRNKARLVAQGHRQEEGIDYNEVFAPVAQAPRAWYATLSSFLLKHGYRRGTIDQTLFLKKDSKDIILVQVYVDDIIFGSTRQDWSDEFEALMQSQFEMSCMGQLTFFLAFSDSDYAGAAGDRKSTTSGCQFIGR